MNGIKLNFLTLIIMNLLLALLVFFYKGQETDKVCFILAIGVVFICGLYIEGLKALFIYGILYTFNELVFIYANNNIKMAVGSIFYMVIAMFPLLLLGMVIVKKTRVNELMGTLSNISAPKSILIASTVAFRYLPTIRWEYKLIRENMLIRGFKKDFNIIKKIEYIWVPLVMRSIKVGEELTISGILRGIELDNKRSNYFRVEMEKVDYIVLSFYILFIILYILAKKMNFF